MQDRDHALRVAGCTEVLESGRWVGKQLVWAYNNRGLANVMLGRLDEALADYDQALQLDPKHSTVLDNRGNAYAMLGDLERALADHGAAIEADPQNARAYNNRAADYMDIRDLPRALPDLDRAIDLDPDYGDAYKNRAQVRCHMGLAAGAEADWKEAMRTGAVLATSMQSDLKAKGHYFGAIDGEFGSGSEAALTAWVADGCR